LVDIKSVKSRGFTRKRRSFLSKYFYRFRSIEALIGDYKELDTQTIYFAHSDELNDPMEGFRDIYWSGDEIVWRNLFRHYLFCLERVCSLFILSGDVYPIAKDSLPILSSVNEFPTDDYKELFSKVCSNYFSIKNIDIYIRNISSRTTPVRRDELLFHLVNLHDIAIEAIFSTYEEKHLIPARQENLSPCFKHIDKLIDDNFFGLLEKTLEESNLETDLLSTIFSAQRHTNSQINLIHNTGKTSTVHDKNQMFIVKNFSEEYINQIEKLLYPEWYTACFMSECSNSSVWGHYGDNHSGICLKFKAEVSEGGDYLTLKGINGWNSSGASYGSIKLKFEPIEYESKFGEVDFFRSLGRLPKQVLQDTWYTNEKGEVSECVGSIFDLEERWRTLYWDNFFRDIKVKSNDWKYENEFRLILANPLDSYSEKENRILEYNFESLEGLIFGIKTTKEDKLKIIETIANKCKEAKRKDFKFYQAYFCHQKNCINYAEMSLIQFTHNL